MKFSLLGSHVLNSRRMPIIYFAHTESSSGWGPEGGARESVPIIRALKEEEKAPPPTSSHN